MVEHLFNVCKVLSSNPAQGFRHGREQRDKGNSIRFDFSGNSDEGGIGECAPVWDVMDLSLQA